MLVLSTYRKRYVVSRSKLNKDLRPQTSAFELMFALLVNHRRQDERLEKQRVNLSV